MYTALTVCHCIYRIAGNFEGLNFSRIQKKKIFTGKILRIAGHDRVSHAQHIVSMQRRMTSHADRYVHQSPGTYMCMYVCVQLAVVQIDAVETRPTQALNRNPGGIYIGGNGTRISSRMERKLWRGTTVPERVGESSRSVCSCYCKM